MGLKWVGDSVDVDAWVWSHGVLICGSLFECVGEGVDVDAWVWMYGV